MGQGGTNVDWTEQQLTRIRQGKVVFATAEADAASRTDLQQIRKLASRHMCNSATEERVWIELREDTLRQYVQWVRQAAAPPHVRTVSLKATEPSTKPSSRGRVPESFTRKFLFQEKKAPAAASHRKRAKLL